MKSGNLLQSDTGFHIELPPDREKKLIRRVIRSSLVKHGLKTWVHGVARLVSPLASGKAPRILVRRDSIETRENLDGRCSEKIGVWSKKYPGQNRIVSTQRERLISFIVWGEKSSLQTTVLDKFFLRHLVHPPLTWAEYAWKQTVTSNPHIDSMDR